MPTVEFSLKDLQSLLGKNITAGELEDEILYAKGELESFANGIAKVDIKDTNRPDLWSVEGIARELRGHCKVEMGLPKFEVRKSRVEMRVTRKVEKVRPKTVSALVMELKLDDYAIKQLIQLQEKIHQTYGRNRSEVAAGVYDYDRIHPPICYTTVKPDGVKFTPLDFEKEMTPREILEEHPKGREYGHLISCFREYPLMIDASDEVLSIPPIINSQHTGRVTPETKNVFIELTGHELRRLSVALNVLTTALAERGGRIYSVDIHYPNATITTPDLKPRRFAVDKNYCAKILGVELSAKEISELLRMARYDVTTSGNRLNLSYPAYRDDIMHPRDVVEDIAISYGLNKLVPEPPKLPTVGSSDALEDFSDAVRNLMTGLGFQEILTFSLTSKDNLLTKMNLEKGRVCEIANPVSVSWSVLRSWIFPSILEFLRNNLHVDYPQRVFEVGDVVEVSEAEETKTVTLRKLACVITDAGVSYEEISSVLAAFMENFGIKFSLKRSAHPSFIGGRVSKIYVGNGTVGVMGELHPQVLNSWGLEKPVAGFEVNASSFLLHLRRERLHPSRELTLK